MNHYKVSAIQYSYVFVTAELHFHEQMLELKIGINIITNHVNGASRVSRCQQSGKAVLSAICGARLPLPSQEVFGFEVKHVSVCLSLLALAVHVFLRFLHHLLRLLRHLMNKRTNPAVSLQNEGFTSCIYYILNPRLVTACNPLLPVIQLSLMKAKRHLQKKFNHT